MSRENPNEDIGLCITDGWGVYVPQRFAELFGDRAANLPDEDLAILKAGPEHEHYWETWEGVLDSATITEGGITYRLWQDGDLWLVPEGMEWDDEADGWVWPEEVS